MSVTYFKRYRMDIDVRRYARRPVMPEGCRLVPWADDRVLDLLLSHAETKHQAFAGEVDSTVFPALGDEDGCLRLMEEIASKPGFLPEATWLVEYAEGSGPAEAVGTIQGIRVTPRFGSIQNVGVTPWGRGRGLGKALVSAALCGFQEVGLAMGTLQVTATNLPAVRMYESLGFQRVRTTYRAVEAAYA